MTNTHVRALTSQWSAMSRDVLNALRTIARLLANGTGETVTVELPDGRTLWETRPNNRDTEPGQARSGQAG
ncbi:MAG TPA: hypothetical protein VFG73_10890 [Rhodanobacteraceae bacterium]|nr:hypothetical protein [Rhodanobacteraceae bacterium]